jgi:hypothetical protein
MGFAFFVANSDLDAMTASMPSSVRDRLMMCNLGKPDTDEGEDLCEDELSSDELEMEEGSEADVAELPGTPEATGTCRPHRLHRRSRLERGTATQVRQAYCDETPHAAPSPAAPLAPYPPQPYAPPRQRSTAIAPAPACAQPPPRAPHIPGQSRSAQRHLPNSSPHLRSATYGPTEGRVTPAAAVPCPRQAARELTEPVKRRASGG